MKTQHKAAVAAVALLGALCSGATDYYVAPGATGDYSEGNPGPSPVDAAQMAQAKGDVIHLATGTYELTGTDTKTSIVAISPGVTMIGGSDDPEETRLVGNNAGRIILINSKTHTDSGVVLRNFTVANGNTAYRAGGVCGDRCHYVASNLVVEGCTALFRGGGACCGRWYDSVIRNCRSTNAINDREHCDGSGGGAFGGTFCRCVITNNAAAYVVGGCAGGDFKEDTFWRLACYDCLIAGNSAPYGGGAASYARNANDCFLSGCTVSNNLATSVSGLTWGGQGGGGFGVDATNCTFVGNVANFPNASKSNTHGGGGVANSRVRDCTLVGNRAAQRSGSDWHVSGGAADTSDLTDCRVLNNTAAAYGGGTISCTNRNCVFAGNAASIGGAAISSVFYSCTVTNNTARDFQAGAAYNCETYNCLVAFNVSTAEAALYRGYHQGDLVVSNETKNTGCPSAVAAMSSDCTVVNCTIADNRGGNCAVKDCALTNTIVVGHAKDVSGAGKAAYSLWRTGDGSGDATNLVGVDPQFVTEVGERTCAWSLKDTSPCVGAGLNLPWMEGAKDLLGNARLFRHDRRVDIGACECWWKAGLLFQVR